ncbi:MULTISPECIES: tetratricopeptide repeat protein [unclassified Motilimonas]|uniref:TPR end-of-group domain-containing protein n=1 Tax=unclassified Motilimonas TaxID=2643697 RepID=UPI001E32BF7B|nr:MULTISPECIES: tetratricopeptide repeat protein [unclassified Motilimonas]MCE0559133.1 tetratricopeptide repeat protein [Motilimonas sp. E26]MDO6525348.1 tetratricopeptide repeat protein [Motilimonas sp. 1_MG-2023]
MPRILIACLMLVIAWPTFAATPAEQQAPDQKAAQAQQVVEALDAPLYNPFVERYVLDELKQLRVEQAATKHELIQQIVDREHKSVDRAVAYATDTVTYFFYLIAAATSVLVIVGWSSIREIKERVHTLADEEISKLINEYEKRLEAIEAQLQQKTQHIEENREEIELTQESQSLWLRAQQESSSANKIRIYDELLKLRPNDCEALTYKADAVLELDEPQWAANLCHQALKIDEENSHAFYQLACAYTAMQQFDEAIKYLSQAISRQESYREGLNDDPALTPLLEKQDMQEIINGL